MVTYLRSLSLSLLAVTRRYHSIVTHYGDFDAHSIFIRLVLRKPVQAGTI